MRLRKWRQGEGLDSKEKKRKRQTDRLAENRILETEIECFNQT